MPILKKGVLLPIIGLDSSKPEEFLDPRSFTDVQNMEVNRSVIRKRQGTTEIGSTMGERTMAIRQLQIGTSIYVVRAGLTKVQVLNQTTETWSDVHHAVLTGQVNDRFDFAFPLLTGSKIMTFTNGIDPIRKFTGSGNDADLGGTPPKCRYMVDYGGYLVLGYVIDGAVTAYSRVQWCDTADPETWSGGNSGSVDLLEDDDDITGLGIFGDFITVHKEEAIYTGYGVTTSEVFRFDRKNTGVGAVSHETIMNISTGEQIFLARDGIHLFNGVTAPLIPSPVMDEMRESMNPEHIRKSWGIVMKELDEYWVAVPIGAQTEPDTIYKYNYRTGAVYKDVRTNISACGIYERTNQDTWLDKINTWLSDTTRWYDVHYLTLNKVPLFGSTTGVTTRRASIYNDNGTAISAHFDTKDFTLSDFNQNMDSMGRWLEMQLWAKGNPVTIKYSIDEGTTWTTISTLSLTISYPTDAAPLYCYFDVTSSKIRFRFENTTAAETFTLKKFIIGVVPREVIR